MIRKGEHSMKKKTVSRILAVMLSAGLMFAMAGCGGGEKTSTDNFGKAEEQTSQAEETKAEETEEAGEGGWRQRTAWIAVAVCVDAGRCRNLRSAGTATPLVAVWIHNERLLSKNRGF